MLLRILIGLCAVLALALAFQGRRPVPGPVSSFNPNLAVSAVAYRYPDDYNPDLYSDIEPTKDSGKSAVQPDSVGLHGAEVTAALETLLDGMHYETGEYLYYKTGEIPEVYGMAMCHIPRFLLDFRDASGRISNSFSICFECNNVYFSNGVRFPRSQQYGMSEEGREAFGRLQARLFGG